MGIQDNGELHSEIDLETLRKENDELKKDLGEATLDIKILKKVRERCKTTMAELESYTGELKVSGNRVLKPFGISKGTLCYRKKGSE